MSQIFKFVIKNVGRIVFFKDVRLETSYFFSFDINVLTRPCNKLYSKWTVNVVNERPLALIMMSLKIMRHF